MKCLVLAIVVLSWISLAFVAQGGESISVIEGLISMFLFICIIAGTWRLFLTAGKPKQPKNKENRKAAL